MLHVCVRRSDMTDTVQIFLETKQSLSFGSSEPNSIKRTLIGWSILKERLAWKLFKVSDFTKCCKPLLAQLTCKLHLFLQGSETNDASEVWIDQDLDEPCHEPWWPLWSSQSIPSGACYFATWTRCQTLSIQKKDKIGAVSWQRVYMKRKKNLWWNLTNLKY